MPSAFRRWSKKSATTTDRPEPPREEQLAVRGVQRTAYTDCRDDATVVLYTVPDGGHVYFGGLQELTTNLLGPNIYATEIIWDFFKDRER